MLNMLIAIMGDSFDRVIENKEVNSTKMKLAILGDLSCVLSQQDKEKEQRTQLVVTRPTI